MNIWIFVSVVTWILNIQGPGEVWGVPATVCFTGAEESTRHVQYKPPAKISSRQLARYSKGGGGRGDLEVLPRATRDTAWVHHWPRPRTDRKKIWRRGEPIELLPAALSFSWIRYRDICSWCRITAGVPSGVGLSAPGGRHHLTTLLSYSYIDLNNRVRVVAMLSTHNCRTTLALISEYMVDSE